jgi:hypothetical protein
MCVVPDDPKLLRDRANEARVLAENMRDSELGAQMLDIAVIYEQLATEADRKGRRKRDCGDNLPTVRYAG